MDKVTDSKAAAIVAKPSSHTVVPKPLGKVNHRIKINDHVNFYDIHNNCFRGIAKWIGHMKSKGTVVVGIEVVSE